MKIFQFGNVWYNEAEAVSVTGRIHMSDIKL
jgi:hypothetical protein